MGRQAETQPLPAAGWRGHDVDQKSFGVGGASGSRVNVIHEMVLVGESAFSLLPEALRECG